MRRMMFVLAAVLAMGAVSVEPAHATPPGSLAVSFGVFYDALSPHGEWVSCSGGVYGWRPVGVQMGWRPYTIGRWHWTDDGWYWLSDEPWGWAVFHYGRWYYDDYYGWVWIPGYDWAPAWVEWRYGRNYVGWAPLSPYAVFSISWGIHYRTRWHTPVLWWNFVDCGYINSPNVHRYMYRSESNTRYVGYTRSAGSVRHVRGRIVSRGPDREYVERNGNVRIDPVRIREVDDRAVERVVRDGNRDQIEVYRPRIEERRSGEAAERPANVRQEGGRSVDLDTRKIDIRAREVERSEGRDYRRADEYRTRNYDGRTPQGRVDVEGRDKEGLYGRPGSADERRDSRSRDQGNEGRRNYPDVDRRPDRNVDSQERDRNRREYDSPQRRESRSRDVDRSPRRQEMNAPQRNSEGSRSATPRRDGGGRRDDGGRRR